MDDKIDISVIVLTYQHVNYVAKALNSVLTQNTKYKYEVIVIDDGSTDGTKDILRYFKRKYPKIIRLYIQKNNTGKATKNCYWGYMQARGDFIALLEGDDYWTDTNKFDKQIKYLQLHQEMSGVFSKCKIIDEYGKGVHYNYEQFYYSRDGYSMADFERGRLPGHGGTLMFRNFFKNSNGKYNFLYKIHNLVADQTLYCILLSKGQLGYIDEIMEVRHSVIQKNGTNWGSIHTFNNYTYELWRYYWKLEQALKIRLGICVNLKEQRKVVISTAKAKYKAYKSLKNMYIYIKIISLNVVWEFVNR